MSCVHSCQCFIETFINLLARAESAGAICIACVGLLSTTRVRPDRRVWTGSAHPGDWGRCPAPAPTRRAGARSPQPGSSFGVHCVEAAGLWRGRWRISWRTRARSGERGIGGQEELDAVDGSARAIPGTEPGDGPWEGSRARGSAPQSKPRRIVSSARTAPNSMAKPSSRWRTTRPCVVPMVTRAPIAGRTLQDTAAPDSERSMIRT